MRLAYADPPYLGLGVKLYGDHHPDAALWDDKQTHLDLLTRLQAEYSDGWAYSCLPRDLAWVLPHVPDARVGVWAKTYHQTYPIAIQYAWEPVVWMGGRPGKHDRGFVRDWINANGPQPKDAGKHQGIKPPAFNRWVLDLLGYQDGDTLDDLFPGSGGLGAEIAQTVLL